METRFNIDFFEFAFLVEACIPPRPIARSVFWEKVINHYYNVLTDEERNKLYDWINKCYAMQHGIEKGEEDCLLFNARFNPDNQYVITTNFDNKEETHNCFLWKDRYHINKTTSIQEQYITKIQKNDNSKTSSRLA